MDWNETSAAIVAILSDYPLCPLLLALVQFVLENNFFIFQDTTYHQEFGRAMGTPKAVNVANAFLFIHGQKALTAFRSSIFFFFFCRYVDDLFAIMRANLDTGSFFQSTLP